MTNSYAVAVIGEWHLAFVAAAVLANSGHKVALVKPMIEHASEPWKRFPKIPVLEPGLEEMIRKNIAENRLFFENGITSSWQSTFVWMAVDTPVNDQDQPDLSSLLSIASSVAKTQKEARAFITNSQVPIGFCNELETILKKPVVYIPENLRLGKGIETFRDADRTVIGASTSEAATAVKDLLESFKTQFLLCNLVTAEMVKHANNIFLATSISFANELARIGETFQVDSQIVAKALKMDKRIGPAAYVAPGLGFAGGTLPRDLRVIQNIGKEKNIPTPLVDAVLKVNESTTQAISEIILRHIEKNNLPKRVLIFGYTYKADTNTLRRSLSLDLASLLKSHSIQVLGYDPLMNSEDLNSLKDKIEHFPQLKEIQTFPSVVIGMTARPEFKKMDWLQLKEQWGVRSVLIVDTQSIFEEASVIEASFDYQQLWSPLKKGKKT